VEHYKAKFITHTCWYVGQNVVVNSTRGVFEQIYVKYFEKKNWSLRIISRAWCDKGVFYEYICSKTPRVEFTIPIFVDKRTVRYSLIFEFVVLIVTHDFSCYIYISWCPGFRCLMIPTKATKIGIQQIKIKITLCADTYELSDEWWPLKRISIHMKFSMTRQY
jgi:hypothetical protein